MLRIVLIIQILIVQQAHALWFFGPDYDDYIMEQNTNYSFEHCKQYEDEEEPEDEVEYVLKCERSQLQSHPIQDEDEVG